MLQTKKPKLFKTLDVIGLVLLSTIIYAQEVPSPLPGGGHGGSGKQESGGVPVGTGIGILLSLGAAYGGKNLYNAKQDKDDEIED
ncbi:MAG: hypothetical protein ACOYN5_10100 [Bacteroidales bacterium]|jgi:hypothetical protein